MSDDMNVINDNFATLTTNASTFEISHQLDPALGPRLGTLRLPGRRIIQTPHYVAISSRGAVPHLSQDTFASKTSINGIYVALEDFIEKAPQQTPPIYNFDAKDGTSALRRFIALQDDRLLVLGPRRVPPVNSPAPNTNTTMSILTSVGFRALSVEDYMTGGAKLRPDVLVGIADIPHGVVKVSAKRADKSTSRSARWLAEQVTAKSQWQREDTSKKGTPALFAPLLPLATETQAWYVDQILESKDAIDGLAVYDSASLTGLPAQLSSLPKLAFTEPSTPLKVLQELSLGVDIFTIPFIGAATDSGIALDFSFPPSEAARGERTAPCPLGVDMWQTAHATSLEPLSKDCTCYACTKHHRAYLQHLLMAKEMLGWVLLQIHNHHIIDSFFAGIRQSISQETFEADCAIFAEVYELELPQKTGQGPRVRGYQFRSEGPAEVKRNLAGYKTLDDASEQLANAPVPGPDTDAKDLEEKGFGKEV